MFRLILCFASFSVVFLGFFLGVCQSVLRLPIAYQSVLRLPLLLLVPKQSINKYPFESTHQPRGNASPRPTCRCVYSAAEPRWYTRHAFSRVTRHSAAGQWYDRLPYHTFYHTIPCMRRVFWSLLASSVFTTSPCSWFSGLTRYASGIGHQ